MTPAEVALALGLLDLLIKFAGKEFVQGKLDGWDVADAQAEALAEAKFGPPQDP